MLPLTPDGARYMAMAERRVARPFHLRWLQPFLCRQDQRRWQLVTRGSIIALAALIALYAHSPWMAVAVLLPGITFSWRHPVLVDPLGMTLALGSALLLPICWPAALLLCCIAACVRETAPIWAAIYAFNPLLLVGLVPVGVRWLMRQGADVLDEQNAWILANPLKAGLLFHHGRWLDPLLMVVPWGGLLAGLGHLTPQLVVALVVAYAQLLVATDSVRLYQWAAPVMALATVAALPVWAIPFAALAIAFNPWRGDGI